MFSLQCLILFLILQTYLLFYEVNCQERPCPQTLTVNISEGTRNGSAIIKDGIYFDQSNYFTVDNTIYGCVCNIRKPCVRKCCGPGEIMIDKNCVSQSVNPISFPIHEGAVKVNSSSYHHFVHNRFCESNQQLLLLPHLDETHLFYVQQNGSLFLPNFQKYRMRNPEHYCVEIFENEILSQNTSVILCIFDEEIKDESGTARWLRSLGMIISMPFLLATFIAYALLPDRNLHMKALMMYVINLMLGYLLLVIIQLSNTRFSDDVCMSLGYFCLFFFLVSFFWMNVICIDIWFTFSGLRGFSGSKKAAERKRFLMYCAYAWGMPVLHVSFVRIIEASATPTSLFKPGIGDGQCFLKRGYPELFYFYGPMAILITINIVFFSITAFKIRNIKKDTSMLKKEDSKRHSYENDKQTFNLYLKLLFAMGVNWSMEIISWAVIWKVDEAPDAIWYLTDFCNAIYGVFIFFIFVFKRSIWKLLKKRYYSFIGKPHLAHSMTMTNTTRVTSYSTANSSVHEHPHGVNDTSTLTNEA